MKRNILLVFLISLLIFACAPQIHTAVKQTNPEAVKGCKFVGEVEGISPTRWLNPLESGLYKIGKEGNVSSARAMNEALEKAQKLGATHVVWTDKQLTNYWAPFIKGNAYKCP